MPCIRWAGGMICTRGKRLPKKTACFVRDCNRNADILCDWFVQRPKAGNAEPPRCSRPCCYSHSERVGPDKHLCLEHALKLAKMEEDAR